jgi:hypothetical protein
VLKLHAIHWMDSQQALLVLWWWLGDMADWQQQRWFALQLPALWSVCRCSVSAWLCGFCAAAIMLRLNCNFRQC